jgi:hypothetical protein
MTPSDDPITHYHTAGHAILGMGAVAAVLFLLTRLLDIDTGFIDGPAILGIGVTFLVVGGLMTALPVDG